MTTYLDGILERKRKDLLEQKGRVPLEQVKAAAEKAPAGGDFIAALREPGIQIIAEVKKASPSRGIMAPDLDPVVLAAAYATNGAAAISVLTEEPHFQGSLEFLVAIKQGLGSRCPPLLRKDFILEPYQIYESRAWQADALLLIVAALTDDQLDDLLGLSGQLGLHCLVEVHSLEEVDRALAHKAEIIGINNRDLRTFETSLATTEALRAHIPEGRFVVSESGVGSQEDVARLAGWGVDALLIGEALVTAPDPGGKLREFLGV